MARFGGSDMRRAASRGATPDECRMAIRNTRGGEGEGERRRSNWFCGRGVSVGRDDGQQGGVRSMLPVAPCSLYLGSRLELAARDSGGGSPNDSLRLAGSDRARQWCWVEKGVHP